MGAARSKDKYDNMPIVSYFDKGNCTKVCGMYVQGHLGVCISMLTRDQHLIRNAMRLARRLDGDG